MTSQRALAQAKISRRSFKLKDYKEFKKNNYYRVEEDGKSGSEIVLRPISAKSTTVKSENNKEGDIRFNPALLKNTKDGAIEIFQEKALPIAEGDRIKWTRNSKENAFVINGDSAEITNIKRNKISFA